MIDPKEIGAKAQEFEINTSDVQRDYVFGWFLFGLFTTSHLKDLLFLKGGNALRKGYFETTRYSADLDFGMENDIEPATLQAEINKICRFVHEQTGVIFNEDQNIIKEKFSIDEDLKNQLKVYEARVYFKDFFGFSKHINIKIQMDITRFDRVFLDIQDCPLIHPYSDFEQVSGTIRCMKLEEIVATKLKCLLQREHPPDLFDYVYAVFFNTGIALDKSQVVSTFLKKTIFEPSPGVVKNILINLPLDFFRTFWTENIVCAKAVMFDVETAASKFKEGILDMFSLFPENSYYDHTFFPAEFRHPIMQAGRTQTLLKMVYKNTERLVEPYSLKYKEAKNKTAKEYLFVYELTGGSKGEPGIRSYIAENAQSIENTETKFTPREGQEITLCKAGEPVEDKYFGDPNRPKKIRAPRVRASRPSYGRVLSASGPKYTYQCSACYKKITKRTMDNTLGPHKNKYKGECYGRWGSLINTKY